MTITVPADLTRRPATPGDLQAVTELIWACEMVDQGQSETIPADVEDMWEDTNLAKDTFVLQTDAGQIVGYSAVCPESESIRLDVHTSVHPAYRQGGPEHALLGLAEKRACQLLAEAEQRIPHQIRGRAFSVRQREVLVQAG